MVCFSSQWQNSILHHIFDHRNKRRSLKIVDHRIFFYILKLEPDWLECCGLWVVIPCNFVRSMSISEHAVSVIRTETYNTEDGDSILFRNVGIYKSPWCYNPPDNNPNTQWLENLISGGQTEFPGRLTQFCARFHSYQNLFLCNISQLLYPI
jgi:hypothetical protein